jgi:hypothetical protein
MSIVWSLRSTRGTTPNTDALDGDDIDAGDAVGPSTSTAR